MPAFGAGDLGSNPGRTTTSLYDPVRQFFGDAVQVAVLDTVSKHEIHREHGTEPHEYQSDTRQYLGDRNGTVDEPSQRRCDGVYVPQSEHLDERKTYQQRPLNNAYRHGTQGQHCKGLLQMSGTEDEHYDYERDHDQIVLLVRREQEDYAAGELQHGHETFVRGNGIAACGPYAEIRYDEKHQQVQRDHQVFREFRQLIPESPSAYAAGQELYAVRTMAGQDVRQEH